MKKFKTIILRGVILIGLVAALAACKKTPVNPPTPPEPPAPPTPPALVKGGTIASGVTAVTARQWLLEEFENPESVAYDSAGKALYVSNMPGGPNDATGKGYISKVGLDGKILEQKWVPGLNAPKGIAIRNGKLYVADLTQIIEIDIATKAVTKHDVAGATFLNDIAINPTTGAVYASNTWDFSKLADASGSAIYELNNGTVSTFASGAELNAPNGLSVETVNGTNYLYVASWGLGLDTSTFASTAPGKLIRIPTVSRAPQVVKDGLGNLDGVAKTATGRFITDYLQGKMMYSADDVTFTDVVTDLGAGAADITVNEDDRVIYIPVGGTGNYVVAYTFPKANTPAPTPPPAAVKGGTITANNPIIDKQEWVLEGFENPESVVYDSVDKVLYVTNMAGGPADTTGKGYISKVGLDGKIIEQKWVSGLNAPKGIDISGFERKLFVADITKIVEIEIATKKVTKTTIPGATFLNDVVRSRFNSNTYLTNTWDFTDPAKLADASGSAIYKYVSSDVIETIATGSDLNAPNGLTLEGEVRNTPALYVSSWGRGLNTSTFASTEPGKLIKVTLPVHPATTATISVVKDQLGNLDGIAKTTAGRFITDYLKGKIMYSTDDNTFTDVVTGLGAGVADIVVDEAGKRLYVPVGGAGNYVAAYSLK